MKKIAVWMLCVMLIVCCAAASAASGTWICGKCGSENTGGNYCGTCGAPNGTWVCTECGHENTTNFCTECGKVRAATTFTDPEAIYDKGVEFYDSGNYEAAVAYFQDAADQGHARAQYNLGVCYENGRGVEQNYEMAAKYYQLAADQGHAKAQQRLKALAR